MIGEALLTADSTPRADSLADRKPSIRPGRDCKGLDNGIIRERVEDRRVALDDLPLRQNPAALKPLWSK